MKINCFLETIGISLALTLLFSEAIIRVSASYPGPDSASKVSAPPWPLDWTEGLAAEVKGYYHPSIIIYVEEYHKARRWAVWPNQFSGYMESIFSGGGYQNYYYGPFYTAGGEEDEPYFYRVMWVKTWCKSKFRNCITGAEWTRTCEIIIYASA